MRYFICILFWACALSKTEPETLTLVVIAHHRSPPPSFSLNLLPPAVNICVILGCHILKIEEASQPAENETLQDNKEYWTIGFISEFHYPLSSCWWDYTTWLRRQKKLCVIVSVNPSSEGKRSKVKKNFSFVVSSRWTPDPHKLVRQQI